MGTYNKAWAETIMDGSANEAIAKYHANQPERTQDCASPSTLTECPRVVWLRHKKHVKPPIPLTWGKAQRLMLGRQLENLIAMQYKEAGNLLWHWKDDVAGESVKFEMGEGLTRVTGTPDLLLRINDQVVISDSKTSMSKSFGYVPLHPDGVFKDPYWYKYKLQVECYYMLCHKNADWFKFAWGKETRRSNDEVIKSLPLPEACHLFSYALDDGVVRREFTWKPTQETAQEILRYVKRWNNAYASEIMPDCTCDADATKFCYYVSQQETTRTGAKIGVRCCGDELEPQE